MRIVPLPNYPTKVSDLDTKFTGAPSAPSVKDLLRTGLGPTFTPSESATLSEPPVSNHPLEARIKKWEETQEELKMEGLRRTFGIAEPIRRGMELKIVREGSWKPACLGGGLGRSLHEDILMGTDTGCQWEDVFKGDVSRNILGFHEEVERKLGMS
ncbi:putative 20s proteasome maturation protein [Erysiphe necator]|uniref:Putative 20s proteasome maturation protein n=1 Tax=Uncinula necator TaxID=52586 RepID=A0A0B1PBQ2_UNCNE|nr:putative 20s proteasome maturation protein [Erysiphe necator]